MSTIVIETCRGIGKFNKEIVYEVGKQDIYSIKMRGQQTIKKKLIYLVLFNFALEYAIRRVQVKQDGLKLNGTHQLLPYADDVNILGGGIHTLKENAKALVAATREIGLGVSADKTSTWSCLEIRMQDEITV